jgi:uncharacterized membrane protein YphA (DoxX/SURF4 family)
VDRPVKKAKKKRPPRDDDAALAPEGEAGASAREGEAPAEGEAGASVPVGEAPAEGEARDEDERPRPRVAARRPAPREVLWSQLAEVIPSPLRTLGAYFGRWLDAPQPVLRLELIRILAPLATLGFMSSRLRHTDEWLTSVGFQVPEIVGGDWRQPLYLSPLGTTSAWALAALMIVSGLAVSAGFKARWAAVIFAATLAYVALADRLAAFTVSKLSPAVMLALAAAPIGSRFSVDAWLRKRRDPRVVLPELVAGGGVRFFQLLLPIFYFGSAVAKGRGDWLTHKLILWSHIHDSYQTGFSWVLANATPPIVWTVLQWVVYVLELGAPVLFAVPRTRPWALLTAVGMHAMIAVIFWPVRWFSLLMISMWLGAFLPEMWLTWLTQRSQRNTAAH